MRADGFTVPVTFDRLTLLAFLLAILALAFVASGVLDVFRGRKERVSLQVAQPDGSTATQTGTVRRRGVRPGRMIGGLVLLLAGLAVFAVAGWFQTYRTLTHNELVGYVKALPLQTAPQTMLVTYTPVENGARGTAQTFTLTGDEWQLGGDIIKWQDYLNILGVHTGYRTTRLMGYFDDANDYRTKRVGAVDLQGGPDGAFRFLRDHPNLAPFVRAVYGNDVRLPPDANHSYRIYVSTSGYFAQAE